MSNYRTRTACLSPALGSSELLHLRKHELIFSSPFYCRNNWNEKCKSYIRAPICIITRVVHFSDLTTFELPLQLHKCFNRRPIVANIILDNVLAFKRMPKEWMHPVLAEHKTARQFTILLAPKCSA